MPNSTKHPGNIYNNTKDGSRILLVSRDWGRNWECLHFRPEGKTVIAGIISENSIRKPTYEFAGNGLFSGTGVTKYRTLDVRPEKETN